MPERWKIVASTPRIFSVHYSSEITTSPQPRTRESQGDVRIESGSSGQRLMNGDFPLTLWYPAIESFNVSLDRREVAFSARRVDNFDIGLVSLDGSEVNWMPSDPADELSVRWAPRGHKISYVIRGPRADFVRTLHIPTSFQYTVDFPHGRVHDVAWDEPAERFAVALESVDASDRVETMKYTGDDRSTAVPPAVRLDVEVEALAGEALLLRPASLRYGEKLPLVVWRTAGDVNRWSDARGALLQEVRAACAIIKDSSPTFWAEITKRPFLDLTHTYFVNVDRRTAGEAFAVVPDPTIPAGFYRRGATTVSVAPGDLESFAAGFIADQLKGTDATRQR